MQPSYTPQFQMSEHPEEFDENNVGLYWIYIGDNGKENGNYYLGFRVYSSPLSR